MKATHGAVTYEVDDQWWAEAGMSAFTPSRNAYRAGPSERPGRVVFALPIAEVAPVERRLSHGFFNDSVEGCSARERVMRILTGFREDQPVPPVEVVRAESGPYPYQLYHGAHRFCCAVLAGFTAVPAVDVTEPDVIDSGFDEVIRQQKTAG
jgi:hypothetical protein